MLINQSMVFGCCVCVDWNAADQLVQRVDVGQIICKLRDNFRIATVLCFVRTPAHCAVTRPAARQCHSALLYTPQRSLYNIQCLS
jgi:hypothetical protein